MSGTYNFIHSYRFYFLSYLRLFLSNQMSVRTTMSTPIRASLPVKVQSMLALRTCGNCPEDVQHVIDSTSFFQKKQSSSKNTASGGHRFHNGGGGGGPRFGSFCGGGGSGGHRQDHVSDDGFVTYTSRRKHGGSISHSSFSNTPSASSCNRNSYTTGNRRRTPPPLPVVDSVPEEDCVVKFSSSAVRSSTDIENRMLARVKGKINKLGFGTYDSTKVFMQQILSSDETEFLDEFMKFVFLKASTEVIFCPLYAKLLHELADEFPHLRIVMHTIFRDYVTVFKEVDSGVEPDVHSDDYKAFVECQERKRGRRGYSQFVGELVKMGEVEISSFSSLLTQIVDGIESYHTNSEKTLMCEEYIDCLANMCYAASIILCKADWSLDLKNKIERLSKKSRIDAPGFTNKSRFALMDLVDCAGKGWTK